MSRSAFYTFLTETDWNRRINEADRMAATCELCPRQCGVDRFKGGRGFCGAPGELIISSIFPHHGEEPPISGIGGSGTVFFTYCTLKCIFCQNHQISHHGEGTLYTISTLAQKLLGLQAIGCHNINLVTPTHFLPWIVRSLKEAALNGLTIPIVYNCGGYERQEVMALLNGIVDIYLPDMKYGDNESARHYSAAPDYVEVNRAAIREMFRQVGPLRLDDEGIARQGLCIRHLVLPEQKAGTASILDFLQSTFDPNDIFISLMAQYRPLHRSSLRPEINRLITRKEYEPFRERCILAGFNGFFQELERMDESFVIDFKKRKDEQLKGKA